MGLGKGGINVDQDWFGEKIIIDRSSRRDRSAPCCLPAERLPPARLS